MAVVELVEVDFLPAHEVASLEGIEGVQLADLDVTVDREGQRGEALQVDGQLAAEQAAAQLQVDERADIGLRQAQVDVAGDYLELAAQRFEAHLATGLEAALLADAAGQLEAEGLLASAAEALQVEIQRADVQRNQRPGDAILEMGTVAAQLHGMD
ncbi:hypothetical protein D9M71_262040 [compost metagenome]